MSRFGRLLLQKQAQLKPMKILWTKFVAPSFRRGFTTTSQQFLNNNNNIIENTYDNTKKRMVQVTWKDGEISSYPHIFLRDNCTCEQCFHPHVKSRILKTFEDVDVNITAKNVEYSTNHVTITWPDDHKSTFTSTWLEQRKFPKTLQDIKTSTMYGLHPILWNNSEMTGNIPIVDYEELMSRDDGLLRHLENLIISGLCIVKNTPCDEYKVFEIGKRMAANVIRNTNYGDIFDVISKPNPSNMAYTDAHLPLHVDLPFYDYQPCIQILHCIEQATGDESEACNILVDAFKVFEYMRELHQEHFDLLSTVKFRFNDVGTDLNGDFNLQYERPLIGLNQFGQVESASINNVVRDSFINTPVEDVIKSYEAYFVLMHLLHEDQFKISYKLKPGDTLIFNNKRVLHGRTSYDSTKTSRWLRGIYLDWDEVLSTFRVLKERSLNPKGDNAR